MPFANTPIPIAALHVCFNSFWLMSILRVDNKQIIDQGGIAPWPRAIYLANFTVSFSSMSFVMLSRS